MHTNIEMKVINSNHHVPVPCVNVSCVRWIICNFIQTACISWYMWVIIVWSGLFWLFLCTLKYAMTACLLIFSNSSFKNHLILYTHSLSSLRQHTESSEQHS